jgi:IS5 family transposase
MTLALQLTLRPALPTVYKTHLDYREQRAIFERIDRILNQSGEDLGWVLGWLHERGITSELKAAWMLTGFRCALARKLTGMTLRDFAFRLTDSNLLQWFCRCGEYGMVHTPSKSALDRLEKHIDLQDLENIIDAVTNGAMETDAGKRLGGLNEPLELGDVFADCTCVKAPIHFPTDWVLLVDAVRTLTKSVRLIRKHGLKHRMPPPESFLKAINKQAMAMSGTRRAKDGKKRRKKTLRRMKKICVLVQSHAERYRALLDERWEETDWTRKQAEQVLKRMDNILGQLPAAKKQAHERIIGERKVANEDKILSLYEPDVHVNRRGKAGAEVEFGNKFYLAEQRDGLLVDWKLYQDSVPSDYGMVRESVERMELSVGKPEGFVTDRGFASKANVIWLKENHVRDGLCLKDAGELRERMSDPWFAAAQKRRSATEGRIGIFKNVFLGGVMREKGFENRNRALVWSVLAHNLWVLARKSLADEAERKEQAA